MKIRIFSLFLLMGLMMMPDVCEAQVSVRRGGSSRNESATPKRDRKDKQDRNERKDRPETDSRRNVGVNSRPEGMAPQRKEVDPAPAEPVQTTPTKRSTPKKTGVKQSEVQLDGMTLRQQAFSEYQKKGNGQVSWQHVLYRELDLTNEKNASLYYPQEPQDGLTNLFRVILEGLCNNQLKAYEFLDGREVFTDKYQVDVKDVLDKFQVMYQQKPAVGRDGKPTYVVEETDVPCTEVLSYYVKERWEFNQHTSMYGPRVLAICPVLHRSGDWGGEAVKYPMFWVDYEDLRPLLRDHLVMSDGMNNTPRYTMEEFFALEQYEGEIYKVQNTRGLSLMQQYPDSASLDSARFSIESQLRGFKDSIWVRQLTPAEEAAQEEEAAARRKEKRAAEREDKLVEKYEAKAERQAVKQAAKDAKRNRRTGEVVDVEAVEAQKEAEIDEIDKRVEDTGTAHSARRSARRR